MFGLLQQINDDDADHKNPSISNICIMRITKYFLAPFCNILCHITSLQIYWTYCTFYCIILHIVLQSAIQEFLLITLIRILAIRSYDHMVLQKC